MSKKDLGLEHLVESDIEGRYQPGSGCLWFAKGDVRNDTFLVECKASNSGVIRVKIDWIHTIRRYAKRENRDWVLAIAPTRTYTDRYCVVVEENAMDDTQPLPVSWRDSNTKSFTVTSQTMPELHTPEKVRDLVPTLIVMDREDFIVWNNVRTKS